MPRKGIFFFATKSDMKIGLQVLESIHDFKYVLTGLFDSPDIHSYSTHCDIPNFGISLLGDKVHMPTFMIMDLNQKVNIREVPQRKGGTKYAIDGRINQLLMFFKPAGEYKKKYLIPGEFAPTEDKSSLEMYSSFRHHFIKGFAVIQSYRVGPEAVEMLDRGIPLTPNHKADPIMYLRANITLERDRAINCGCESSVF